MVFSSKKVESALLKKGFILEPKDHRWFVLYYQGKRTMIKTCTSNNGQDITQHLISCMKKQLRLSKKDFERLIECPLQYDEYIGILKEQGLL